MSNFFRILFWLALCFAVTMAILPQPPQLPGGPSDKVQHMTAFAVLSALAWFGYPKTSPAKIALALVGVGGGIEVVQMIPFLNRSAEWMDLFADSFAIFASLGVLWILLERGKPTVRQVFLKS